MRSTSRVMTRLTSVLGVGPGDDVLEQRRHVDQRGGVSDRVVLVLVVSLVRADGVVPRPVAIVERLAQRKRARVKRRTDGHSRIIWERRSGVRQTEELRTVRGAKRIQRLALPLFGAADNVPKV